MSQRESCEQRVCAEGGGAGSCSPGALSHRPRISSGWRIDGSNSIGAGATL